VSRSGQNMCIHNTFYTYAYMRRYNKTPYYIGKGSNGRAYGNHGFIPVPKDKSRIIFLKTNLTEGEAFMHEIYMISILGRKDLGTGILLNRTNGGEGQSGRIYSEESRQKMKDSHTGKTLSDKTKQKLSELNTGKTLSEEHKRKISKTHKGITHTEETKRKLSEIKKGCTSPNKGKPMSEEQKRKLSEINKGSKHPMFGRMWVTNETHSYLIDKAYPIPEGYRKGRVIAANP
jgi:hypothetical protein